MIRSEWIVSNSMDSKSMDSYERTQDELRSEPARWLVTGAGGFIGSHLVEKLLSLGQDVVGLDNFSTGYPHNLEAAASAGHSGQWQFIEGDIRSLDDCRQAVDGVDYVLHQAALGSVPRSVEDPLLTNSANIDGFLNVMVAARDAGVKRLVYAASSSTYGDHPGLPKVEDQIGRPLSPYAVTKYVNELYADVFHRSYGFESIGLRYFNVFGPRQDPQGAYAAVIPCWFGQLMSQNACQIHGDGETSRDFCYIDNVVQANLLSAVSRDPAAVNQVYNVAFGASTTLNELFYMIRDLLGEHGVVIDHPEPTYGDFRAGDVRYSLADIGKASQLLGYHPVFDVRQGLQNTAKWFVNSQDKDLVAHE